MIDDLKLPARECMPEVKSGKLSPEAFDHWVNGNIRLYSRAVSLRRIRDQASRQPVKERFRLV